MYNTGLGVCRIPDEGGRSAAVMLDSDHMPAYGCRASSKMSSTDCLPVSPLL
jgi:hypothetical protein